MSPNRRYWFPIGLVVLVASGCQFPGNERTENASIGSTESSGIESNSSSNVAPANFEGQVASGASIPNNVPGNQPPANQQPGNQPPSDVIQSEDMDAVPDDTTIHTKQSLAESFLFAPKKYPHGFSRLEIEGQRVKFSSEDGTKLEGRWFLAPQQRGVILFCHGNAGNLASRTPRMEQLKKRLGYSIFLFDYRGYGRSDGKPTVSGVLADGRAAVRKAAEMAGVDPSEVIIMGRSLGGAVAIQLAKTFQSPKLIVESTFTSFRDIAKDKVSFLSALTRKHDLDSVAAISQYRGQVLFSHSTADKVIPYKHGKALYEKANQPKQFYEVQNAGHNDPMPESYLKIVKEFVDR